MLLFKGPVRGAFCALSRHGFRGFDWEFCYNSRPFIFNAGSLTLSVDSTAFSFLLYFHFICMLVFVYSIFHFVFLVGLYRIVIVSRVVITDCSSLVNFFANMCYHALLCNHLCNVLSSFML